MLESLQFFFSNPLEWLLEVLHNPAIALWGPFVALLICGLGLPMPEDIILVAAGFLSGKNGTPVFPVIVVTYLGIILGDTLIFIVGQRLGTRFLKSKVGRKVLTEARLQKAKDAFHKYGIWVNFFGRFLPGVRTAIFFTGGSLKYPFHKFFLMDGIAALISAPAFVWLGHWAGIKFAENTELLEQYIKQTKTYLLGGIFLFFIIVITTLYIRSKKDVTPLGNSK